MFFEETGGGGSNHAPDRVDDATIEKRNKDIFLEEEAQRVKNCSLSDSTGTIPRRRLFRDIRLSSDHLNPWLVDAMQSRGSTSSYCAERLGEEHKDRKQNQAAEDSQEPKDRVVAKILRQDPAKHRSHTLTHHPESSKNANQASPLFTLRDIANDARANGNRSRASRSL